MNNDSPEYSPWILNTKWRLKLWYAYRLSKAQANYTNTLRTDRRRLLYVKICVNKASCLTENDLIWVWNIGIYHKFKCHNATLVDRCGYTREFFRMYISGKIWGYTRVVLFSNEPWPSETEIFSRLETQYHSIITTWFCQRLLHWRMTWSDSMEVNVGIAPSLSRLFTWFAFLAVSKTS